MTCVVETCDRPVKTQGWWCDTHHTQLHIGGVPKIPARRRIMQILEVDGGWMTQEMIAADFGLRWPDIKPNTIRRAYHRLVNTDGIETRMVVGDMRTGWNGESLVYQMRAL